MKAASGKEQEMVSGNTCDLSDLWYYQTVNCIDLSANRKWWLGAIFGVPAKLGPSPTSTWQIHHPSAVLTNCINLHTVL